MTYFATGYLFSSFVQAVQILSYLKEKKWKGRLIWNVIDTIYESSVQSKFADQSLHTKSILCFKEQIARILPQEIAFELNVFSSHSEYIVAANEDEALKFNCIVGMDPGDADYIWRKRDLSLAGYLDAFEFLLYKPEEIPHHILGQVKDRDHLDYQAK